MSSMSIPSSMRAISAKIPLYSHFPPCPSLKPLISSVPSSFKSISFQRLTKKPQSLSSSSSSSSSSPSPSSSSPSSSSLQPIEELPPKLQEIIKLFQATQDPRAKYQQLMFYANNLSPLENNYKIKENKVEGCVSQVWVRAFLDIDSNNNENVVHFEADSDSIMTKGLAALLVLGLSGRSIPEILRVSPDFVTLLGLHQNLTPSRNNGFLNMLKTMQQKALRLGLEAEKEKANYSQPVIDNLDRKEEIVSPNGFSGVESLDVDVSRGKNTVQSPSSGGGGLGKRGERIKEKLRGELKPIQLELEDISYQHAGHAGVKGSDGETHFNLKIVSNEFEGKSLVKRHRMIYGLLQDELEGGLHALSIIAKTQAEA